MTVTASTALPVEIELVDGRKFAKWVTWRIIFETSAVINTPRHIGTSPCACSQMLFASQAISKRRRSHFRTLWRSTD